MAQNFNNLLIEIICYERHFPPEASQPQTSISSQTYKLFQNYQTKDMWWCPGVIKNFES